MKGIYMDINHGLKAYIEDNILPRYEKFDDGHNIVHVRNVIGASLTLAKEFGAEMNRAYTVAAYHDLGLDKGREEHHIHSAAYLREDKRLNEWFSPEDIEVMAQAVEDHRASGKSEPRSLYGKIVADADREYTVERLLHRTISYGKKNYPELCEEEHLERAFDHCVNKYGPGGYMHFYLKSQVNNREMMRLHRLLENKQTFFAECKKYL